MATATAPRMTTAEIEEYLELERQRKELERRARALGKQSAEIAEKMIKFVRAKGGKQKTASTCGYRLAIETKKKSPPWKAEFIAVTSVDRAEKLIAEQPEYERLALVEPIG